MGRQSIPTSGPRPHGSSRGRGERGRGKGRGRGRSGRGRGINVDKSLQQKNTTDCNQHQKQCTSCHKNTETIKELQSKTTAGLLCLDEMTSVLDKLRIYLEDIQNDAAGLIESNYNENGAGGIHCQPHIQQETASNTPQTLQEVINARPQYLTVPPSTYISWLENELEITTLADLQECINECINDVKNGNNNIDILARDDVNGHVWIKSGMRGAFRKYILRISAEKDASKDLQQEIVQISNRLDVDSAEEIVRGELSKDNDKSHTTSGKKTRTKKLPEGGKSLSTKEQRDDCNNNGFKSISDEVRRSEKKAVDTAVQGLVDSTATHPNDLESAKKTNADAKRSASPRGSASAICNLVGSMDSRSKKASAKAVKLNSKSPTPALQQSAARVASPKTKASPKGAAKPLDNVSMSTSTTSPVSSGKVQTSQAVNQKGSEQMTSKGKIVGSLPPPTPPPQVTPFTPPKVDKKTVEDVEQDKSSTDVTSPKVKAKAIEVDLPAIKKEQKKPSIPAKPSNPFGKEQFALTNLSQYIKKSNPNSKKSVNSIFGLIQNEDTRDMGRRLIELEGKAYKQHKTISNLIRMKEDAIKAYSNDKVSKKDDVDQRQKEMGIIELGNKLAAAMLGMKGKEETSGQREMKEDKKREMERTEKKEKMIANYDLQIADETKKLEAIQDDLRKVKGPDMNGIAEDPDFHIDNNRDDRGYTYLMVATSNDDFDTAKICLDLGADPSMSVKNDEGLSAIHYSDFFGFDKITDLIMQAGGILPDQKKLSFLECTSVVNNHDWDSTLKIAEAAAIPPETLFDHPEKCETDPDLRMNILSEHERQTIDFTCFDARLEQQDLNPNQVRRVVHIEQSVYKWLLGSDDTTRLNFVNLMEGLKPASTRKRGVKRAVPHRRATIGVSNTFDLFAVSIVEGAASVKYEKVVLCSPFVSGESDGVSNIGVLVWAVVPDAEASLYKTLISNTEFMRHKTKTDDRYLRHKERNLVLELGKDMHLLDLHSTSIWTTSTMDLYTLDVDKDDLDRIQSPGFVPKKRIVRSEEMINKAIFRAGKEEAKQNEDILASRQGYYKSTLVMGGAGTGKTLLMIKKLSNEDSDTRILVLSRLPRLIKTIKVAVEEERDDNGENITFTTYDDQLQLMARRVMPDDENDQRSFLSPHQVKFESSEEDKRPSFSIDFIGKQIVEKKESTKSKRSAEKEKKKASEFSLTEKDRKQMNHASIEPLTSWQAIISIKSNAQCANTKVPLTREEYVSSRAFGLSEEQRELCYEFFLKYEKWRKHNRYWDETDRVMYVLKHGPCVFREEKFVPWIYQDKDVLDDEGFPQYPFFFDMVCADESQDFTELEIALFVRMSASIQSFFLAADPCQSVESGICMKEGTVNNVVYFQRGEYDKDSVDPLQTIRLETNHRTHQSNLEIGQAIRRILARSFRYSFNEERALINGKMPEMLKIDKLSDLAGGKVTNVDGEVKSIFCGGNIVFLAPDENVTELRLQFSELGIENDIFGVREAKGLEFDSVALIGFFSYIENRCSGWEWNNVLLWLSSTTSLAVTDSAEMIMGRRLNDCDYRLTNPQISDEAMMLYTALTRAKDRIYLIEGGMQSSALSWREKLATSKNFTPLVDEAFRILRELSLAKTVKYIDGGEVEMSPSQHKARGVLMVTQALTQPDNFTFMKDKFEKAFKRFGPDKGNDTDLLRQAKRHFRCIEMKRNLLQMAKKHFYPPYSYSYNLEGKFDKVLLFEQQLMDFAARFLGDNFFWEEVKEVRCLVEEMIVGTLYEFRFVDFCIKCREIGC